MPIIIQVILFFYIIFTIIWAIITIAFWGAEEGAGRGQYARLALMTPIWPIPAAILIRALVRALLKDANRTPNQRG